MTNSPEPEECGEKVGIIMQGDAKELESESEEECRDRVEGAIGCVYPSFP